MQNDKTDVVVVGGGISGLCAAHWLVKSGFRVRVLEKETQPGGTMKTRSEEGFLSELGPNSALETTPHIATLVSDIGLDEDFLYADPSSKNRFILRDGTLRPLPLSPLAFLKTDLFSIGGKLRLLKEPFIGRAAEEESIADFVIRRLGREFLDYAIDPFVAGIFAARPEALSVRAAFPKLYALEETYGGLIRGMIFGRKKRKARREQSKDRAKSFSFRRGMQSLPLRLAESLGEGKVACRASVSEILVQPAPDSPRYVVNYVRDGQPSRLKADAVILATPAEAAARLIRPLAPTVADALISIQYPPVVSVFLGYRQQDVDHPMNGFGFLVPSLEKRQILGCLWSSSLFPHRAPAGSVGMTVFIGGGRQPELALAENKRLFEMATQELESIMQIRGKPVYWSLTRWEKAIPQYTLGYHRVMETLSNFEQLYPGMFFCSNFRGGISVGDCIQNSESIARQTTGHLRNVTR